MAIHLTDTAAQRVRTQLVARGHGLGLRLSVKPSGCSGFSYVVDYVDERCADDLVFSEQGVSVFVDPVSLSLIDGTRIDYVKQGLNESFRFLNPKASAECGCGESFSIEAVNP